MTTLIIGLDSLERYNNDYINDKLILSKNKSDNTDDHINDVITLII